MANIIAKLKMNLASAWAETIMMTIYIEVLERRIEELEKQKKKIR